MSCPAAALWLSCASRSPGAIRSSRWPVSGSPRARAAGLAERGWRGKALRIGDAVIGVRQVRGRCVMTTFDPDTLDQDLTVLQKIVFELDGVTALDCYVVEPGRVRAGDDVELLDYWTLPRTA